MPSLRWIIALSGMLVLAPASPAQEWTRFRGPNGTGIGQAKLPLQWTDKDFAWKVPIAGAGYSSPVLWGEKLFLTTADTRTGKRTVLCLNAATGATLWTQDFDGPSYKTHLRNSLATGTPTVDADRIYVSWPAPAQHIVMALDHQGKLAWQTELGPVKSQHGHGVSLIVHEDLVIVPNEQDGSGTLIALDRQSGKVRWKLPRHSGNATYSTPCVYQPTGRPSTLIFTNWKHGITAVDPSTGTVAWETSVFAPNKNERAVASPVIAGDLVLGTCGFVTAQKHFVAVRPDAHGKPQEIWRLEKAVSYLPTPLVKDKWVFLCSEVGTASCLEAATGKVLWQERLPGSYSASPVLVGDRLYCTSNDGDVLVLAASDKYQLLARNALGDGTQSTPAVANGRIYFRTKSYVIALGGGK